MKSKYLKIRFIFQPFEGFELGFYQIRYGLHMLIYYIVEFSKRFGFCVRSKKGPISAATVRQVT